MFQSYGVFTPLFAASEKEHFQGVAITKIEFNISHENQNFHPKLLHKMDAYWRAANYLSVGQIYLYDNPLLKRPLKLSDVKPLVVGHWGTTPGQNFIYVHLNRVIKKYDLNMFYVAGPGHGGRRLLAMSISKALGAKFIRTSPRTKPD